MSGDTLRNRFFDLDPGIRFGGAIGFGVMLAGVALEYTVGGYHAEHIADDLAAIVELGGGAISGGIIGHYGPGKVSEWASSAADFISQYRGGPDKPSHPENT